MQSADTITRAENTELDESGWTHRHVDVGEVRLHIVEAGPEDGELVVLLHGFPEFWWSWRFQIPKLAAAGFRVVAPDMRGYNLSDKPYGVDAYRIEHLVRDVVGLVQALGRDRAHLVGHDWGGAVAWEFAQRRPELTKSLTVMNCPHPHEMAKGLFRPSQVKKSWYMFFFQLPGLPEKELMKDDASFLRRSLKSLPKEDVARYVEAAKRARGMNGPLNYYRASMRALVRGGTPKYRPIVAPVLVLWGEADRWLEVEMARPDARWVSDLRVELVPGATHWVHIDAPAVVNRALLEHLRRAR
jgi:pimeloyl-ACP methyl ester carboxylesterase